MAVTCCRYLLPPIIFYAGISVKKKQFFRNFASIAFFGVLGTYIAFAVIACVLYAFSKLPNVLNFSVSIILRPFSPDHQVVHVTIKVYASNLLFISWNNHQTEQATKDCCQGVLVTEHPTTYFLFLCCLR